MLTDIQLIETQIAIFPNTFEFDTNELIGRISPILTTYSIKSTLTFKELPPDIIRITLKHKTEGIEISISPQKIAYIFYSQSENTRLQIEMKEIIKTIVDTYQIIVEHQNISRVGYITKYAIPQVNYLIINEQLFNSSISKFKENISEYSSKIGLQKNIDGKLHNHIYNIEGNAILTFTGESAITILSDINSHQSTDLQYTTFEEAQLHLKLLSQNTSLQIIKTDLGLLYEG